MTTPLFLIGFGISVNLDLVKNFVTDLHIFMNGDWSQAWLVIGIISEAYSKY